MAVHVTGQLSLQQDPCEAAASPRRIWYGRPVCPHGRRMELETIEIKEKLPIHRIDVETRCFLVGRVGCHFVRSVLNVVQIDCMCGRVSQIERVVSKGIFCGAEWTDESFDNPKQRSKVLPPNVEIFQDPIYSTQIPLQPAPDQCPTSAITLSRRYLLALTI